MKKLVLGVIVAALVVVTASVALASPAEVFAGLEGVSVSEAYQLKNEKGATFGELAAEAGKLAEFKAQMLKEKKELIDQKVKDGIITQEQGEQYKQRLTEKIADCTGTNNKNQERLGLGFGQKNRKAEGKGSLGLGRGRIGKRQGKIQ